MTLHHTKEECKRLAGGRVEACRLRRISRGQPFEGAFVAAKRGATDINGDTWAGQRASQPAKNWSTASLRRGRRQRLDIYCSILRLWAGGVALRSRWSG